MSQPPFTVLTQQRQRRGGILALSAVLMVVMMAFVAFSVDLGVAYVERAELQRTADAAAIAAAGDLLDQQLAEPGAEPLPATATAAATQFAEANSVGVVRPSLLPSDLLIGEFDLEQRGVVPSHSGYNAAWVRVQRSDQINGQTPFFFARALGHQGVTQTASAVAAYYAGFRGFGIPSDGSNLGILPIALDIDTWNDLLDGVGQDDWTWNAETGQIESGTDGILEVNLYPQGVGLPGNRGTVDIGHTGNSTNDIKRQILDGVSPSDLEHHGGKLEFDSNGEIHLNGDTGISAGIKEQLNAIKGKPRVIPIFDSAAGNGNNANFVIVKFAGVRIMEVKLNGKMSGKRVIIQPAPMTTIGGIPTTGTSYTEYIYSPVSIVR